MEKRWRMWFDGLCEPTNPGGRMCWAYVLLNPEGEEVAAAHDTRSPAAENTNNIAEWFALGSGLKRAAMEIASAPDACLLDIYGDSKLVVNQINGTWACKAPHLAAIRGRCQAMIDAIRQCGGIVTVSWVGRDQNDRSDALTQKAYEEATGMKVPVRHRKAG